MTYSDEAVEWFKGIAPNDAAEAEIELNDLREIKAADDIDTISRNLLEMNLMLANDNLRKELDVAKQIVYDLRYHSKWECNRNADEWLLSVDGFPKKKEPDE